MKIDWERPPVWHLYVMWYVLAGLVVVESLDVEVHRQCEASSSLRGREKLVAVATWPATATMMILLGMDPLAVLTYGPRHLTAGNAKRPARANPDGPFVCCVLPIATA